mmetsp:Transcript_2652/g.3116  ORF Transcript_2652/g.3116 Transcript_2652/m.3116 type:complete len:335 (+) Transcript_2652:92-1096(+)
MNMNQIKSIDTSELKTSMSGKVIRIVSPSGFRALLSSSSNHSRVIPIDASWYMPNSPFNGKDQFLNEDRIKSAAFFDLDSICLPDSQYPHMLPPYSVFNKSMSDLGIRRNDTLVVYDKSGIFSSPRAAWNLSLHGHDKVYLLNNYNTYKKYEYPVEMKKVTSLSTQSDSEISEYEPISEENVKENYRNQVIDYEELLELVQSGKLDEEYITFDARSSDRFSGASPEPRPGLSSGHIPSSLSLPFSKVLNQSDNTYKTKEELIELFKQDFGIDFSKPNPTNGKKIIVMCGTGVTAVILRLALESVIQCNVPIRVYDGSWTEWAQRAPSQYIVKTK